MFARYEKTGRLPDFDKFHRELIKFFVATRGLSKKGATAQASLAILDARATIVRVTRKQKHDG